CPSSCATSGASFPRRTWSPSCAASSYATLGRSSFCPTCWRSSPSASSASASRQGASRKRSVDAYMGGMKRRHFLLLTIPAVAAPNTSKKPKKEEVEIGPVEDLMREHGILRRVLLVYDEVVRRMRAGEKFDPEPLSRAAKLVQVFVEDYHEKNEEQY